MEWVSISGDWGNLHGAVQPGLWDAEPSEGSLPTRQAARMAQILEAFTTSPLACWFAVWDGYGDGVYPQGARSIVPMPERPMVLFAGPIRAVTSSLAFHDQ